MSIFPKRTPGASAPKTDAPTGGDLQALRRRHAAIEKEAAALAHRAVSKTTNDTPPAPGQALAHAQGLAAAIEIAEGMAAAAETEEAPARARLADARDALHYGEWMAARAEFEAGLVALMPGLAHLRSTTLRCQAPWSVPELGKRLRAFDHAQGTAEPLGGR